jgi:hypothetical protein
MKRRDFVRLSGVGAGALLTGIYGCEPIPGIDDEPIVNPIEPGYGSFKKRLFLQKWKDLQGFLCMENLRRRALVILQV